jgi:transcriptional regulator with XRE-family HTH domain
MAAGVSQEDLADRLGIDRRQVVRLEAGQAEITLEVIEALASAFQVDVLPFLQSLRGFSESIPIEQWRARMQNALVAEFEADYNAAVFERPEVMRLIHILTFLPIDKVHLLHELAAALLHQKRYPEGVMERDALRPVPRADARARKARARTRAETFQKATIHNPTRSDSVQNVLARIEEDTRKERGDAKKSKNSR